MPQNLPKGSCGPKMITVSREGKGDKNGYVQDGKIRNVPLEVYVKGDKEPIYSATFDDDGRGGYAAALPFNAYGALGMAREEYNVDSVRLALARQLAHMQAASSASV